MVGEAVHGMHPAGCAAGTGSAHKVLGEPVDWHGLLGPRWVGSKPGWAPVEAEATVAVATVAAAAMPVEAEATVAAIGWVGGSCLASPERGNCPKNGQEPGLVGSNTERSAELPGGPDQAMRCWDCWESTIFDCPAVRPASKSGFVAKTLPGLGEHLTRGASIL